MMATRVFLAGAAGVIGQRLVPLLAGAGYDVFGTTRSPAKAEALQAAGVQPIVVNVFDAPGLEAALAAIKPEIVIHQLTDLPQGLDPTQMGEAIKRNALIRSEGTHNLVAAARKAGARRLVAQSIVWAYAPGLEPHGESDPLDLHAKGSRAISISGVAILEQAVLNSPPLEGVVLRYGQLYGPGTGSEEPTGSVPLHVDAAAWAALLAVEKAKRGIFNIAEPSQYVSSAKATIQLGWTAEFRLEQPKVSVSRSPDQRLAAPATYQSE
jgi:nucleoside-diphosphate-sugar epimerase